MVTILPRRRVPNRRTGSCVTLRRRPAAGEPATLPLETHHEIEALVPEGQRACVPSHERDAGAARARFLQRRLVELEPVELRPRQRRRQARQQEALAAADSQYAAGAFYSGRFRRPAEEAPRQVSDDQILGPTLPVVVAPLGPGDQSSRRRIETSSVRDW